MTRACQDARIADVTSTTLSLSTGQSLTVAGSLQDVEKLLQNAARSSPGTIAWLTDAASGASVGVNPTHVVTVMAGEDAPLP
jgi:hypothetical protein